MRRRSSGAITKLAGRPSAVSDAVITAAIAQAEALDLSKNSCTSSKEVVSIIDRLRHEEQDALGENPHALLPKLSASTARKLVKKVTPVSVTNGSVQNTTRMKALTDARNSILCAATWAAVTEGIENGKFIHSFDEVGVMLNAFNEKQTLKCTNSGRKKLAQKNLSPATTDRQEKRRMLKLGLSEFY